MQTSSCELVDRGPALSKRGPGTLLRTFRWNAHRIAWRPPHCPCSVAWMLSLARLCSSGGTKCGTTPCPTIPRPPGYVLHPHLGVSCTPTRLCPAAPFAYALHPHPRMPCTPTRVCPAPPAVLLGWGGQSRTPIFCGPPILSETDCDRCGSSQVSEGHEEGPPGETLLSVPPPNPTQYPD